MNNDTTIDDNAFIAALSFEYQTVHQIAAKLRVAQGPVALTVLCEYIAVVTVLFADDLDYKDGALRIAE